MLESARHRLVRLSRAFNPNAGGWRLMVARRCERRMESVLSLFMVRRGASSSHAINKIDREPAIVKRCLLRRPARVVVILFVEGFEKYPIVPVCRVSDSHPVAPFRPGGARSSRLAGFLECRDMYVHTSISLAQPSHSCRHGRRSSNSICPSCL